MNLSERIEKTKPYFVLFNVSAEEDAIYAIARFPEAWTMPDTDALRKSFKVEVGATENGAICFATETKNGPDCVFDALDYVIDFNKCAEKRRELLIEKLKELKELFATESLEKLSTLTFTFEKQKKTKMSKKSVEKTQEDAEESKAEEETTIEETKEEDTSDDSSLMSFAKNIVDD